MGIDRNVNVEAIVTKLNNGTGCNIGNQFFAENLHLTDIFLLRPDCRHALQVDQRPEQVKPAAGAQHDIADDRRTDALMDSAVVEAETTRAGAIRQTGERTAKVIINDT